MKQTQETETHLFRSYNINELSKISQEYIAGSHIFTVDTYSLPHFSI